eukprot:560550-Amphidinium_carterae.1
MVCHYFSATKEFPPANRNISSNARQSALQLQPLLWQFLFIPSKKPWFATARLGGLMVERHGCKQRKASLVKKFSGRQLIEGDEWCVVSQRWWERWH